MIPPGEGNKKASSTILARPWSRPGRPVPVVPSCAIQLYPQTCEWGIVNTIVHTSVHTTFTGPSLHLYTLNRRVVELTEISGQPGIATTRPGQRAQLLAARGLRSALLPQMRQNDPWGSSRYQQLCDCPRADLNNLGLSGYLRELNNAPEERRQV